MAAAVGGVLALPGVSVAQAPAGQDSVAFTGGPSEAGDYTVVELDATSGPGGENPSGRVVFRVGGDFLVIGGSVTCLAVRGDTATLNIQDALFGIVTVQVTDGPDNFDASPLQRAPTDGSPLPPSPFGGPLLSGDISVVDATQRPTSKDECKNDGSRKATPASKTKARA